MTGDADRERMTTSHGDAGPAEDLVVRVRDLRMSYRGKKAVDGVDLDLHRGEVFALLGPNGAGKTTTVEILEGYRSRDSGEVEVLGADPGRAGLLWRSRIGIVMQTSSENYELTVQELVRHFALYYPDARDPDEVVQIVGLWDHRGSRTRALSGGMRRRLDVALGIVGRPELLFLDEPTTGFDPQARRSFWELVRNLRGDGTTILLTTHYLEEAEYLADRVGVIAGGQVIATGTTSQLIADLDGQSRVLWRDAAGDQEQLTGTPTQFVADLALQFGGEVPQLRVLRPSLEDVYLSLIDGSTRPSTTRTDEDRDQVPVTEGNS